MTGPALFSSFECSAGPLVSDRKCKVSAVVLFRFRSICRQGSERTCWKISIRRRVRLYCWPRISCASHLSVRRVGDPLCRALIASGGVNARENFCLRKSPRAWSFRQVKVTGSRARTGTPAGRAQGSEEVGVWQIDVAVLLSAWAWSQSWTWTRRSGRTFDPRACHYNKCFSPFLTILCLTFRFLVCLSALSLQLAHEEGRSVENLKQQWSIEDSND